MYQYQFAGIRLIPDEVRDGKVLIDKRWKQFNNEELNAILDGFFNYESGEVSNKCVCDLVRSLMTEVVSRENEGIEEDGNPLL